MNIRKTILIRNHHLKHAQIINILQKYSQILHCYLILFINLQLLFKLFINLLINVVPLIETLHEQIVFKYALLCTTGILFEDMPVFIKKFNVFGQMEHALFACIELIQVFLKEDINEYDIRMGQAHTVIDEQLRFVLGEYVIEVSVIHLGDID